MPSKENETLAEWRSSMVCSIWKVPGLKRWDEWGSHW